MALRESATHLISSLASIVRTRLELFVLEARGEKAHWIKVLIGLAAAGVCLVLALLVFTAAFAVAVWPTDQRYLALFALAFVYALVGGVLLLVVRRKLNRSPLAFSATLEELQRDLALLERLRDRGFSSDAGARNDAGEP